jgi:hypothetical protein
MEEKLTAETLKAMSKVLEDMQLNIEPIRDKALNQQYIFTGYAQCAEQIIKIIMAKSIDLKNMAQEMEKATEKTIEIVEKKKKTKGE